MRTGKHISYNFKDKADIIEALLLRGQEQERLFKHAQQVRDGIFLKRAEVRSVIEYSNICRQACNYCGMNRYSAIQRYILSQEELLERVKRLYRAGRRVIMLQAGELNSDVYFRKLYGSLRRIKQTYSDLTLICSFGNLAGDKYRKLRDIGIDRYLLKFETSDYELYKQIKPSDSLSNRLAHISILKKLGFYVSSGNITGLPGQSLSHLADDLLLLKKLDIPMGSTSPFIPNNMSNYADYPQADLNLVLNFMAILRIMCPDMLIPATSALELLGQGGQYSGLKAGANTITLHDGTPRNEEKNYIIYNQDRYKPRNVLFNITRKAGLEYSNLSLIRDKIENSLFYKLINKNIKKKTTAIQFENNTYTYSDLLSLSSKFCSLLRDNGIQEGQIVLLAVHDSIEFIIAFLSCIRLGIVVVPLDPQLSRDEWDWILDEISPQLILAGTNACRALKNKKILKIADEDSPDYFFSLIEKSAESNAYVCPDRNNPALILYTSGTTGKPKGAVHTYRDLFVDNFPRTILKMSEKDVVFSCSRMHTSFGLGNSLLFPLHLGAGIILCRSIPNPFSLQDILDLKPTLFFAVPSMYGLLLNYAGTLKQRFQSVRLFISSGEKLYSDILRSWEQVYQKKILECYGTSEMCHPFISNIPGRERAGTCGRPVEGFMVRFNKSGRIFYKGPSLTPGYYNDAELTRKRIINGWFRSDDIGYMNKEGYIFIAGRDNLVFKLNGRWISILDIEEKLRSCRLLKEAVIVKKQGGLDYYVSLDKKIDAVSAESQIRRYCANNLKIYELPRNINILDEIPKTRGGKNNRKYFDN